MMLLAGLFTGVAPEFKTLEEQADFNTTMVIWILIIVALKFFVEVMILRFVFKSWNDLRVVMRVVSAYQSGGTGHKIEDMSVKIAEMHTLQMKEMQEIKQEAKAAVNEAKNAACSMKKEIEQGKEEIKEEVRKVTNGHSSF
jgi:hypothetical protein